MTGRDSCPPEWQQVLIDLAAVLTGQGANITLNLAGCALVQPMPLCDAGGNLVGYVAVQYDCGKGASLSPEPDRVGTEATARPLFFNSLFQPVASLPAAVASQARPCGGFDSAPITGVVVICPTCGDSVPDGRCLTCA